MLFVLEDEMSFMAQHLLVLMSSIVEKLEINGKQMGEWSSMRFWRAHLFFVVYHQLFIPVLVWFCFWIISLQITSLISLIPTDFEKPDWRNQTGRIHKTILKPKWVFGWPAGTEGKSQPVKAFKQMPWTCCFFPLWFVFACILKTLNGN